MLDAGTEEKRRGITITASAVTLEYDDVDFRTNAQEGTPLTQLRLNLIDCPGHVEFSAEVIASLRLADGALVLVDSAEGTRAQTEAVLRAACAQRVRPTLLINKCDKLFLNLMESPTDAADRLLQIVHRVNAVIADAQKDLDLRVSFDDGTVAIGSGYFGWAATFQDFERYMPKRKAKLSTRSFLICILRSLQDIHVCIKERDHIRLTKMLTALNLPSALASDTDSWKESMKQVMREWLPAADNVLRMISAKIMPPRLAQKTRLQALVVDCDSDAASVTARCEANGPLLAHIVKMVPVPGSEGTAKLGSLCRVFSGTIRPGDWVRVAGSDSDGFERVRIRRVLRYQNPCAATDIECCAAGDTCVLVGLASAFSGKSATLVGDQQDAKFGLQPFVPLPHAVKPVVAAALLAPQGKPRRRLIEALQVLVRVDPCAVSHTDAESGQTLLMGSGELHMEVCLANLRELCGPGYAEQITMSPPIVCFRESCSLAWSADWKDEGQLGKSANRLNRVYIRCSVLDPEVVDCLENQSVTSDPAAPVKLAGTLLRSTTNPKDIWAVGPVEPAADGRGPSCVLVNRTTGVERTQVANVQDSLCEAFQEVTLKGPIANQRLRGLIFEVVACKIHADRKHCSPAQVVPAASRAMRAAMLASSPTLQEPLYSLTVHVPSNVASKVFEQLHQCGASHLSHEGNSSGSENEPDVMMGMIPVRCALGLTEKLRGSTSGRALLHLAPGGWAQVPGDVYGEHPQVGSKLPPNCALALVEDLRRDAGLAPEIPTAKSTADSL